MFQGEDIALRMGDAGGLEQEKGKLEKA